MMDYMHLFFDKMLKNIEQNPILMQFETPHMIMIFIGAALVLLSSIKRVESMILIPMGLAIIFANLPGIGLSITGFEAALKSSDVSVLLEFAQILKLESVDPESLSKAYSLSDPSVQRLVNQAAEQSGFFTGAFSWIYQYFIVSGLMPMLIFFGLGSLVDLSALISNPKSLLLGLVSQAGVVMVLIGGFLFFTYGVTDLSLEDVAMISLVGSGNGSLLVYVANKLGSDKLILLSASAYFFIALLPMIQPPILLRLTTQEERRIRMTSLKAVGLIERLIVLFMIFVVIAVFLPVALPFIGVFCFGNLLKELAISDGLVVLIQRLVLDVGTLLLALAIGSQLSAELLLDLEVLGVFSLSIASLVMGTVAGVLFAKFLNLICDIQINPLIGAAGVSAIPVTARTCHQMAQDEDKGNYILMEAVGASISGFLASGVIASFILGYFMAV